MVSASKRPPRHRSAHGRYDPANAVLYSYHLSTDFAVCIRCKTPMANPQHHPSGSNSFDPAKPDRIFMAASSANRFIELSASSKLLSRTILRFVIVLIDAGMLAICLSDAFLRRSDHWTRDRPKNFSSSVYILFSQEA